jgi:hypothetical protein
MSPRRERGDRNGDASIVRLAGARRSDCHGHDRRPYDGRDERTGDEGVTSVTTGGRSPSRNAVVPVEFRNAKAVINAVINAVDQRHRA